MVLDKNTPRKNPPDLKPKPNPKHNPDPSWEDFFRVFFPDTLVMTS